MRVCVCVWPPPIKPRPPPLLALCSFESTPCVHIVWKWHRWLYIASAVHWNLLDVDEMPEALTKWKWPVEVSVAEKGSQPCVLDHLFWRGPLRHRLHSFTPLSNHCSSVFAAFKTVSLICLTYVSRLLCLDLWSWPSCVGDIRLFSVCLDSSSAT